MITNTGIFKEELDKVTQFILNNKQQIQTIRKSKIYDYSVANIKSKFSSIFRCLPHEVEENMNSFGASVYTIEIFDLYYEISASDLDHATNRISTKRINQSKEWFADINFNFDSTSLIDDVIEDYFHALVYHYSEVLENTKKLYFLDNIDSEQVILKNFINLYRRIQNDKEKQIQFFWGISLPKEISEVLLKLLIRFLEQRLITLTPELNDNDNKELYTFSSAPSTQLNWEGKQIDLVELFIELGRKGWISPINNGDRKKISNSITNLFNLEQTRKNPNSNLENSFYQKFKGENIDGNREFSFDNKTSNFSEIKNRLE